MTGTAHAHPYPHEDAHRLPPSGPGTVVLDIGGSVGALVVHTPAALAGLEIELARRGETVQFVHAEVRERQLAGGSVHAAVFAAVPEGAYILLDPPPGTDGDIVITPGRVTEVQW